MHAEESLDIDISLIRSLRQFERCRVTNGYSIETIFNVLNPRGAATVPVPEFADNVSIYCNLDFDDAIALGKWFDSQKRSEISIEDMKLMLSKQSTKSIRTISGMLEEHPLFPHWLIKRSDFQNYFAEWGSENGAPNIALVEAALELEPEQRKSGDLQIIFKWIKLHKILRNVKDSRLLDVCHSLLYFQCPENTEIVHQGDLGDSFYIALQGSLDVFINDINVGTMVEGMSFGEKALENNAPRAATIKTTSPCKLMILRASEYKNLVASAQAKTNQEIAEFLHVNSSLFAKVSYARLHFMVKKMVRRALNDGEKVFLQGSKATCIFIVFKGRVELSKRVPNNNAQNVRSKLLNSFKDRNSKKQEIQRNSRLPNLTCSSHININIQDIDRGSVFGENAAIDSSVYEYNAVSKGVSEIIVINDKDIKKYFDVSEMDIYRE